MVAVDYPGFLVYPRATLWCSLGMAVPFDKLRTGCGKFALTAFTETVVSHSLKSFPAVLCGMWGLPLSRLCVTLR